MNSKSDGSAKEQMVACAVKVPGAAENMTLMSGDDRGRTYGDVQHTLQHPAWAGAGHVGAR